MESNHRDSPAGHNNCILFMGIFLILIVCAVLLISIQYYDLINWIILVIVPHKEGKV